MQVINWDDHRFILAVARQETLTAAARQMGVNESTVARRIARAETDLGSQLFERVQGRLVPTDACHHLIRYSEDMERAAAAAATAVHGRDATVAGTVRVTSVPIVTDHLLTPAVSTLLAHHPELTVDLIAEPRELSLTRRQTDIALRLARPTGDQGALARRIGSLPYAVYAHKDCDPSDTPWLTFDDTMANLPQARWIEDMAQRGKQPIAQLRVHDSNTLLAAIRAGLGKSLLPMPVTHGFDELAVIGDGTPVLERELWLMIHPDLRDLVRIRAVVEWLDRLFSTAKAPLSKRGTTE